MELLRKYRTEIEEFMKIDDFNMEERAKKIPSQKHHWVARLIDAKINREVLLKQKKKTKNKVIEEMLKDSPVTLDKKTLDSLEETTVLEDINENIKDHEILIEYLEHVVKIFSFIDNSIKNIVAIKQLEQN